MTQLIETRQVNIPVADAFAYTADFANIDQWDPGVARSSRTDDGKLGVGATFDVLVAFGSRRTPMIYEITQWQPPDRVVLHGTGKNLTAIDDIRFSESGGITQIDYIADLEFSGLMRFLVPFLGGTLRKVGANALDGLANQLNSTQ